LYDLVVKSGLLIDPSQGIHENMDLAASDGKVEAVERSISESHAKRVVDASGMIVVPGLVDIHTHTAYNLVRLAIDPERACLLKGTTTAVDAGSTGELLYPAFEQLVINRNRTRILTFLNIESLGMIEFGDFPPKYTDQEWPGLLTALDEFFIPLFINIENTIEVVRQNRDTIVGVKWAHHGPRGLSLARETADEIGCMLMIENHHMPEALKYVKKGDLITHIYHHAFNSLTHRYDGLTDDGSIYPEFHEAVKRGVLLDVGHGKGGFSWKIAELALKEGLKPHCISTDLWVGNINGPVYDMPTTMAKFLHLGMTLEEVVEASTATPATALGKAGQIGTLKAGACADATVFKLQEGRFPLVDTGGEGRVGTQMLIPIHVIRGGEVIT